MQMEKIIEIDKTDCVLSSEKLGFRPSDNYLSAVICDENITRLITCGVEIQTKREVFNAMAFTPFIKMCCPVCNKNRFEGITEPDFYSENLTQDQLELYHSVFEKFDSWSNGEEAILNCPFCHEDREIGEYITGDGLSLSNFGLTFWNWPEFKPEFMNKINDLIGAKTKVIVGHI